MIREMILLFSLSFLLGILARFAGWMSARVVVFRQKLFVTRDELWDEARRENGLDDPAYKQARRCINAVIQSAASVSLPAMLYLWTSGVVQRPKHLTAKSDQLQSAIDSAYQKASDHLFAYIFRDTLVGRFAMFFVRILISIEYIKRKLTDWVRSDAPAILPAR